VNCNTTHYRANSSSVPGDPTLLVEQAVVVELKVTESLAAVHEAQLLAYLKLGGWRLGYLLNFNTARMKDGIKRMVNGL